MSSIQETNLKAIADAIRAKDGTTASIQASKFPARIAAIETGITPKLVVTTSAGATVTATKGSKTVSGTAGTNGTCTLDIPEAGEWTITVTSGESSKMTTINAGIISINVIFTDPVFENNSWENIIAACHTNDIPDTWVVGSSKNMTINGTDYQIDIIGKNHDDYADGSGKAPLTFMLRNTFGRAWMGSSNTNAGGWKECRMRNTVLPGILEKMPSSVQNGIREVRKKTSMGNKSSNIETVSDKLFLLSEIEIFGTITNSAAGEGTYYNYFDMTNARIKTGYYGNTNWSARSPDISRTTHFISCGNDGAVGAIMAYEQGGDDYAFGISFAFCF